METFRSILFALLLATPGFAQEVESPATEPSPSEEWITLFDGSSLDGWTMTGPGSFTLESDGSMLSHGGMGLFYYAERTFEDFVLELDFQVESASTNSGIFVRFPDASTPWAAVSSGYEIQILDDADPMHQTGAVYDFSAPFRLHSNPPGTCNTYRIQAAGQHYEIFLNGEKVNDFFGSRGLEGHVGVQNHDEESRVRIRNVRAMPLDPEEIHHSLPEYVAVSEERDPIRVLTITATHGFRHGSIATIRELLPQLAETTEFEFDVTEDMSMLNDDNLSQYDLLFFANSTLRVKGNVPEPLPPGDVFDFTLNTPDGVLDGSFAFQNLDAANARGTIRLGAGSSGIPLDSLVLDGTVLSFSYDTQSPFGRIRVSGEYLDDTFDSQWQSIPPEGGAGMPFPVLATRRDPAETPPPPEGADEMQRQAIRNFLGSGKGIAGAHAGLDAFYEWGWYREMTGGGLFKEHPWTRSVRIRIEKPEHPAVEHFGEGFWIRDEIYVLDVNPRPNSVVLASLDLNSIEDVEEYGEGLAGDYPISWIREQDGGRVFFTKLGHFDDVWTTPAFVEHLLQGLRIAAGRIPTDFQP